MIIQIKYPTEIPRTQRSLEFRKLFKANEFKTFIFYSSFFLKNHLPNRYFNHLLHYIVFLRILCQDKLDEDDIFLSFHLIQRFINDFELLYGRENLTYNLHSHIHLPFQALNFGPINKISSFPFEGMFKVFRRFFHGTKSYVKQITKNLALERTLFFNQEQYLKNMNNKVLYSFTKTMIRQKFGQENNYEITFQVINNLTITERQLLENLKVSTNDLTIKQSFYLNTKFGSKF